MLPWTDTVCGRFRAAGAVSTLLLLLTGCATGPDEADLLPDEGPTTLEVYERHLAGLTGADPASADPASADPAPAPAPASAVRALWAGEAVAPEASADSRATQTALDDLRRDFQRVPNLEIVGYVYPHWSGDLPVPGYYTVFPLRESAPYAESGEGVYLGVMP